MAFLKGKAPSDKSESTAAAGFSLRCSLRLGGFSACPHPNGRFPMPLDLRNGFFPQILDQSGRCQVANPCPGNNDDIQIGRQLGFQLPIRLSNEPFCTISLHRIADPFAGGDAQSVHAEPIRPHINHHKRRDKRNAPLIQGLNLLKKQKRPQKRFCGPSR